VDNKKKDNVKSSGFMHNSEFTGEVPTLTTLLNRKKLQLSTEAREARDVTRTNLTVNTQEFRKQVEPSVPEPAEENEEPQIEYTSYVQASEPDAPVRKPSTQTQAPVADPGPSKVLPTNRPRAKSNDQDYRDEQNPAPPSPGRSELLLWDPAMMAKSPNPFANALAKVMRLIPEGLYMAISQEGGATRRVPLFKSHAAFTGSEERMSQLTGIYWDPEYYPDLWKSLLQTGVAETAPGTHEPLKAKFGYQKDVTLLIALVGPATACRGLAVFASKNSIKDKALSILGPLYVIRKTAA